ncbi:MAG: FAD-dependent oxidoreductase, partial [Pseudomonadota bacterium]
RSALISVPDISANRAGQCATTPPARFAEISGTEISAERPWTEEYPHYVGVPGMNAVGKHLAADVDVRYGTKIESLERQASTWSLDLGEDGTRDGFDWVIVTAPAAQTAGLLPQQSSLTATASAKEMKSCFALMLGFNDDPGLVFDAALVRGRDISWISVNSSKPGRDGKAAMVVHATNAWADANLERPLEEVRGHMLDEVRLATGIDASSAAHVDVQRWRYANIDKQDPAATQIDADARLAVCGDWLIRGRVESAFLSAEQLLTELEPQLAAASSGPGS